MEVEMAVAEAAEETVEEEMPGVKAAVARAAGRRARRGFGRRASSSAVDMRNRVTNSASPVTLLMKP